MKKNFGIRGADVFIGVRECPDRKKPCFVVERDNEIIVLGTFRNESMVDEFEKAILEIAGRPM